MSVKKYISTGAVLVGLTALLYLSNNPFSLDKIAADSLAWVVGVLLIGGALSTLKPRLSHLYLLGIMLAWLSFGAGLAQTFIVIFWFLSAWSMGAVLLFALSANSQNPTINATEAGLLGAAIWLAVWGAMLHFPINYSGLYLILCLLPFFWLPRLPAVIWTNLRLQTSALHDEMRSIPLWAWTLGLALIGWTLQWASFPSAAYDDHALHLRLWTELLTEKRALFDVQTQIWSVAPFTTDLLHAGLSLMAGADARSAMNLMLALMLLMLLARTLQRLNTPAWVQWLLVVLMASTPMLGNLLLALHAELLLGVLALAGLRLVIDAKGGWRGTHVLGVLACAALCASLKLPGAVLGVTLLAALALRWWSESATAAQPSIPLRWPAFLALIPLVFVAFHSYALAWSITGNPVFPLYNGVFLSPYAPASNFSDARWTLGFSLSNYVRAFFETSAFLGSGNYAAGWQYLLLLPAAIFALWRKSVPAGFRIALLPLLGYGLAMFSATQYWRYLFPVMPIAGIVIAALFIGKNHWTRAIFTVVALLCIVLNIKYFTQTTWMMEMPAQMAYSQAGKAQLSRLFAPAAVLTAEVNRLAPGSRVLYSPDAPYGATLQGHPLYLNWYAPLREARFAAATDAQTMARFLAEEKVDFAILNISHRSDSELQLARLREHMARYGVALAQENVFMLYQLNATPVPYRQVFDLRSAILKLPNTPKLMLPASDAGVAATPQARELAVFPTQRASHARYSAQLRCDSDTGSFVAQINWDIGPAYYRLVPCQAEDFSFVEAIPVPLGASQGLLHVTVRDTASALVKDLQVELN